MNEISVLIKHTPECSCLTQHVRTEGRCGIFAPGSQSSPDTKFASALVLDFPASGAVRNIFLLFASHPIYVFC